MRILLFLTLILNAGFLAFAEAPQEIVAPVEIGVRDVVIFRGVRGKVIAIKREKGVNWYSIRIQGTTYFAIRNQLLGPGEYSLESNGNVCNIALAKEQSWPSSNAR